MILVTGGAGFIGSNLIRQLNKQGEENILVVDDLTEGRKAKNLVDCVISDYEDKDSFINRLKTYCYQTIQAVFHLGACSDTTEWDGRYMMRENFTFSRELYKHCVEHDIPFVYASSASVYGAPYPNSNTSSEVEGFSENPQNERPLNVYGYSKLAFDQYVRANKHNRTSVVVGLRYFNVYGPREAHKQTMASVVYNFDKQIKSTGVVKVFRGSHGYLDGEHKRDFVYVADAVNMTLWASKLKPAASGIYNCGSGVARTFNELARLIVEFHGKGEIEYIDFPSSLLDSYQAYTKASMERSKDIGYSHKFKSLEMGIKEYLSWLNS
jgi:ADP-L-glycero-D-manno-heptose 6-epimerase